MAYTQPTLSGYNSNPPPDDGSTGASNTVSWATHKNKLADPLKTFMQAVDTNVAAAFAEFQSTSDDTLGFHLVFHPRTSAEQSAGVTPVNYEYEPGNVLRYGTNTTPGTTDMTTAIQNALDVVNTAGGGIVLVPAGTYYHSANLDIYKNTTLQGEGQLVSILTSDHTGDGINSTWTINSSTAVNIVIKDLEIKNTNASNTGGGFVDVGGTYIYLENVIINGFKYNVILDQSELVDLDLCYFASPLTGGVWLVNGDDHTVGASGSYTNRISIKRSQFNAGSTGIAIIDDGGYTHAFEDNNYNGWAQHGRFAGVLGLSIRGGEWESATGTICKFTSTSYNGGDAVGQCVNIDISGGPIFVPTAAQSILDFDNGSPLTLSNVYFGNTTAGKIIGVANIARLFSANVYNAGGGATFDGKATSHTSIEDGNISFPATQSASSDANTLDDYEEGTWTPALTFATAGDLSVAYSTQSGIYTKIGRLVSVSFDISTSTFTHTTASGNLQITGLPFASAGINFAGSTMWQGITKASYTEVTPGIASGLSTVTFVASGSGQTVSNITASDMPTAGTVLLRGQITYSV